LARKLHFESLEPRQLLAAANLLVNEFMATNTGFLVDGDGNLNDWIEIRNADTVAVNLGDYYLSDNDGNLEKWKLPNVTLNAGAYRVFYASAPLDSQGEILDNYVDAGGNYHANFKLDAEGEDLVLSYKDPTTHVVSIVHQYAGGFPDQFPNVSYGIASDGVARYFSLPTRGAANNAGLLGAVEDTKFSVDRGFFDSPFQLTITTDTPGATIYYTTNGSVPSLGTGTLYTGPITIDKTTVVRAIATKSNHLATNVDTQTYLFLNDIVRQTQQTTVAAGYPATWTASNGTFAGDYGFDPDVIGTFDANGNPLGGDLFGGIYANRLKTDLLAIPTVSIVLDRNDLFKAGSASDRGLYIDPREGQNVDPERPTSVEWITPDGSAEFQVDAGIQMHGGAFRSHVLTRKHSFRLVFKDEYGPSELEFPLFDESSVNQFNTVILSATSNDGYSWSSSQQTLQYARNQFGNSLQNAMGYPSPHDTYAHLYINGLYWGLYVAKERPDAEFAASYLGINPDNWDGIHDNEANTGDFNAWNQMLAQSQVAGSSLSAYMALQGKNLDGTPSAANPALLDVVNYIDYLIINAWGGNDDWPRKNFWAGRDRSPETTEGFQFFVWDFDGVMGNSRSWSPLDTKTFNQGFTGVNNVGQMHDYLKTSPEYQLQFADRVHKHLFNDGLLTPDKLVPRYQEIVDQVQQVIVAESARWGDMHSGSPLTLAQWTIERDWMLNTYLLQRSAYVIQEMRDYNFYPDTDAASFNQQGGFVPNGFDLTMSAPAGTIYYTLDGSDPRLVGGAINSASVAVYSGTPIDITGEVTVKARVLNGGEWSALNETTFTTTAPGDFTKLRITELQYHPANFPNVADDEDAEFIEVLNTDSLPVSLDGIGIGGFANDPYEFDAGLVLEPGQRIVVARNPAVFQSIYGSGINLAPTGYPGRALSNGGELVTLLGPQNEVLQSINYSDSGSWPSAADGSGRSLEINNPLGNSSDPTNWRASLYDLGSPGAEGLPIAGDYDANGEVAAADHATWITAFGSLPTQRGFGADGNRDGHVDAADYSVWRDNLGSTTTLYGTAGGGAAALTLAAPLYVETNESSAASDIEALEKASARVPYILAQPNGQRRGVFDRVFGESAFPVGPVATNLLLARRNLAGLPYIAKPSDSNALAASNGDTAPASKAVDQCFAEIAEFARVGRSASKIPLAFRPLPSRL
jgi:hypothetical protein